MDDNDVMDDDDELEPFDDFTLASPWERFVSTVEGVIRRWLSVELQTFQKADWSSPSAPSQLVEQELMFGSSKLSLSLNFHHISTKNFLLLSTAHPISSLFGIQAFLLLCPVDSPITTSQSESSMWLGTLSCAMSACGCPLAALVPAPSPKSKAQAYRGIQLVPGGALTLDLESASMAATSAPARIHQLEGARDLFMEKLVRESLSPTHFHVSLTYWNRSRKSSGQGESSSRSDSEEEDDGQWEGDVWRPTVPFWDATCPWSVWHNVDRPIKGYELCASWQGVIGPGSSASLARLEQWDPTSANQWRLRPLPANQSQVDSGGFSGRLRLLAQAYSQSLTATSSSHLDHFISDEGRAALKKQFGAQSAFHIPPDSVISRIMKDIFDSAPAPGPGLPYPETLFAVFSLHALQFGDCNLRAMAGLWKEFRAEVEWYFLEGRSLPRMDPPLETGPDTSACAIHQKLQMLAICIHKKQEVLAAAEAGQVAQSDWLGAGQEETDGWEGVVEEGPQVPRSASQSGSSEYQSMSAGSSPAGSFQEVSSALGEAGGTGRSITVPSIQEEVYFTVDSWHGAEGLEKTSGGVRKYIQAEVMFSDMSAFKWANPACSLEDFLRWYSPSHYAASQDAPAGRAGWKGRWSALWERAPAVAADKQKPLFSWEKEAEKALHYFDQVAPSDWVLQLLQTSFSSARHIIAQSPGADLEPVAAQLQALDAELEQLAAQPGGDSLLAAESLQSLCRSFEVYEQLATYAAATCRDFIGSKRLHSAVVKSAFAHSHGEPLEESFVGAGDNSEREIIASLFSPMAEERKGYSRVSQNKSFLGAQLHGYYPHEKEICLIQQQEQKQDESTEELPLQCPIENRMYIKCTESYVTVGLKVVH